MLWVKIFRPEPVCVWKSVVVRSRAEPEQHSLVLGMVLAWAAAALWGVPGGHV